MKTEQEIRAALRDTETVMKAALADPELRDRDGVIGLAGSIGGLQWVLGEGLGANLLDGVAEVAEEVSAAQLAQNVQQQQRAN